jgi:hypothetical protein
MIYLHYTGETLVSAPQRVWGRVGMLALIAFLGSACSGGTNLQPVPYHPKPTEVDLDRRDTRGPARYSPPRHVSQYRYDETEVDLASPRDR